MGLRIEILKGEPITSALRRFRTRLERLGIKREILQSGCLQSKSTTRRVKAFRRRFKAREAALEMQLRVVIGRDRREAIAAFWRRTGKP